ncbi:hypothetical protein [Hamadaea tsunoensis]|uniref:hypothetical protein n=1 Tax=Hamadaea tsunoensis TaxID=53368 RepID=UPI000428973C|nr:hypothetical protein [Hamadaea tsunoensis]
MHHANHFYGHAHVMAQYCGLDVDPAPRILGYLQHGWNIGDGLAPGTPYAEGSPLFLWSDQTRRRAWSLGRRNTVVTGAPFAYLLRIEPEPEDTPPREGTIWYPFHGWEAQEVKGDHRRLIEQIRDVEDGPVTICLYWQEFQTARVRRVYERAGFRVICHGYRGQWWRKTDKQFLYNQLAELRRHKRVASNRLTSAVFYGTVAGCEPAVYGDPMVLHAEDPTFGGQARIRRQWPEMHGAQVDLAVARHIANEELGMDYVFSPEVVMELFGWTAVRDRLAEQAAGLADDIPSAQPLAGVEHTGAHR